MLFNDDGSISFRQSWFDTASRCPEEGRLAIVNPDMGGTSDEAFIGTAAHAGIEVFLNGASVKDARGMVRVEYATNPEARDIRFTKRSSIEECIDVSERCFDAFVKDIYPNITPGGQTEVKFKVKAFTHRGIDIYLEGTADYVPPVGSDVDIEDWKTSGKDYSQKNKQKWAVQPSFYAWAATLGAFGREFELPLTFRYGVMVKLARECRGQQLVVERTQNHIDWTKHRLKTFVDMALDYGTKKGWPQIDEDNWLCSAKWCDFYDLCRGAFVPMSDDLYGYDPVAVSNPRRRKAA